MNEIERDLDGGLHPGGDPPRFDQPLSWSVPVLRIGSTILRVHASFLAVIVVVLVRAAWNTSQETFPLGPWLAGILLASLVTVVLLHELITLLVTRRLGGDLPEIVLQPLGGLDDGFPPRSWRRAVLVAMAGPMAVTGLSIVALVILSVVSEEAVPIRPWSRTGIYSPLLASSPWLEATFVFGQVALVVAAANLLPAPPFRGRLLLQSLLRPQVGNRSAVIITRRIGMAVVVMLFAIGVVTLSLPLVLVAAMCAAALQRRNRGDRVSEAVDHAVAIPAPSEAPMSLDAPTTFQTPTIGDTDLDETEEPRADIVTPPEELDLDKILKKISESGIESLDADERSILDKATRRRREDP